MGNTVDDFFLALAAAIPLPTTEDEGGKPASTKPCFAAPRTLSKTTPLWPSLKVQIPYQPTTTLDSPNLSRKKRRKPSFAIFADDDDDDDDDAPNLNPPPTSPKRPRISTARTPFSDRTSSSNTPRTPFSDRTHSTNSPRTPLTDCTFSTNNMPAPSPRLPDTPFTLSPDDANWENTENYTPFTEYSAASPRPTSHLPRRPSTGRPPRPPRPRRRNLRPCPPLLTSPLVTAPVNMTLYDLLGVTNWRASTDVIRSCYRRAARMQHPDHATSEEGKKAAHGAMQCLNAAKEVLLDERLREEYHRTGDVPWS